MSAIDAHDVSSLRASARLEPAGRELGRRRRSDRPRRLRESVTASATSTASGGPLPPFLGRVVRRL